MDKEHPRSLPPALGSKIRRHIRDVTFARARVLPYHRAMRTIALLASVFALSVVTGACTTEETETTTKPKSSKTKHPGATNTDGEHGAATTADDPNGDAPPAAAGDTISTDTWQTKTLAANGTIAAGATVTIAPGATITVGDNVTLTVKGTLKVDAASSHAKMTGANWKGLVIAEGGKLEVDGLEMTGPQAAIWTQTGSLPSTFKNGVIDAGTPFKMESGSNLTVDHSKVKASSGSAIAGTFTATFMEYDKTDAAGLTLNDPEGTMTLTDCTLTGAGSNDYVITDEGKLLTVTHTSITGSHCAFHFNDIASFQIDAVDVRNNGVGGMLYGSGAGPNVVKNSNFVTNPEDISFGSNKNGNITFTNNKIVVEAPKNSTNITITGTQTDPFPLSQVGPRTGS